MKAFRTYDNAVDDIDPQLDQRNVYVRDDDENIIGLSVEDGKVRVTVYAKKHGRTAVLPVVGNVFEIMVLDRDWKYGRA